MPLRLGVLNCVFNIWGIGDLLNLINANLNCNPLPVFSGYEEHRQLQ